MNRISDDPLVVALGHLKDRIYAARAAPHSALFDLVAEVHAYRDALARCDMPDYRLVQAKEELADRLADGWVRCEREPRLESHWLSLLVRYEAVCDALDLPAAHARLAHAEAAVYLTAA